MIKMHKADAAHDLSFVTDKAISEKDAGLYFVEATARNELKNKLVTNQI